MSVRVQSLYLLDGRVGEVVVMVVGDDHRVHVRDVFDLARHVGVSLWAHE